MDKKPIVFFDIDGTLLDSNHKMLSTTKYALKMLNAKNIPFAVVSARSPNAIFPVLEENEISCNIIAFSGALVMDENHHLYTSRGFSKNVVKDIIHFLHFHDLDCSVNVYANDKWITPNKDSRVRNEEKIVGLKAKEGRVDLIDNKMHINKIMLICSKKRKEEEADRIEHMIKDRYPNLSVFKSSPFQIEIMGKGINKGSGVRYLCRKLNMDIRNSIAFGDNYNDEGMFRACMIPVVMGNAPKELKKKYSYYITDSNDNDGIYKALVKLKIIEK